MHGMNWGLGGGIMMVFWWILIAIVIVALIRYLGQSGFSRNNVDDALTLLKKRYVRGEINKDEFEEIKRNIG